MSHGYQLLLSVLLGVTAFILPSAGIAAPSPTVPLDSWVYPAVEKLEALGMIDSALEGDRPWSRFEVARLVDMASAGDVPTAAEELLDRFHRQFASEITELRSSPPAPVRYLHLLDQASLGYQYRDGDETTSPGVNAVQFPLVYNRDGRRPADAHALEGSFAGAARYGLLLAQWRPLLEFGEGGGADLRLLDGGITLSAGPVDVFAGRQQLWWGQGRHGSLILTNNARPLDMLRLTNPEARPLPWIFKYLGPCRFDLFISRLESERAVAKPYLGGLRLSIKPFKWFELGASRTAILGGKGRPAVSFSDFIQVVVGTNPPAGSSDNADSIAAFDARLCIPSLAGFELYGELGGEDEAHHFFSKTAWIAGAFLPRLDPAGRLSLRLEYADLAFNGHGPVWYRHGTYASGYTYDGLFLGHHAGGDARDYYGELAWQYAADLDLQLSCDYEERGVSGPVRERHLEPGIEGRLCFRSDLEVRLDYRFDRVNNFDRVAGDNRGLHWLMAEVVFTR